MGHLSMIFNLSLFRSARTAAVLMITLGVITVYGAAWHPSIFASYWFAFPVGLLFINTFLCSISQFKRANVRLRRFLEFGAEWNPKADDVDISGGTRIEGCTSLSALQVQTVVSNVLRRVKYKDLILKVQGDESVIVCAKKDKLGYWGSPLFHSALLLIMVGGVLTGYGRTVDNIVLTEGGKAELNPGVFSVGGAETLVLEQVRLDFDALSRLREWTARVKIGNSQRQEMEEITSQHEFLSKGRRISIKANGYTPGIVIREENGETLRLRVRLKTVPLAAGVRFEDDLALAENQKFHIEFLPNYTGTQDRILESGGSTNTLSRREEPINPALLLQQVGQNTFRIVRLGESTQTEKYTFSFDHVKPWLMLEVRRDPGYPVLVLGLGAAVLGLTLIFVANPRRIYLLVSVRGRQVSVHIKGESDRYPALFASELKQMILKLTADLGLHGTTPDDNSLYAAGGGSEHGN